MQPLLGTASTLNPWYVIVVLAIVQGITEFLPISSDGHLVIIADLLANPRVKAEMIDVEIVLHMGTLLSILVYYWHRVWRLLGQDRRLIGVLIVGTLPAVIVGLPLKKFASAEILENPILGGLMLPVTGLVLIWGSRAKPSDEGYEQLSYGKAILIGISQAFAILPGLSRSGLTISTSLRLGLSPAAAAQFSFLLAIPALIGAGVLELIDILQGETIETPVPMLLSGAAISFAVGLIALWCLDRVLKRGRFQVFAYWCIPFGLGYVGGKLAGWW